MTKAFLFHTCIIRMMDSYANCMIDLDMCQAIITERHRVIYGCPPDSTIVHRFNRQDIKLFLSLCGFGY